MPTRSDSEQWCASGNDNIVFRIDTATHTATTFDPPLSPGARPDAVTAGPDGNLWVDTVGGDIDVLVNDPIKVTPSALTFSAPGQTHDLTIRESGHTQWTVVSSNPGVATVAGGGSNAAFKVTAVAGGSCAIRISDGTGNTVAVQVAVK